MKIILATIVGALAAGERSVWGGWGATAGQRFATDDLG